MPKGGGNPPRAGHTLQGGLRVATITKITRGDRVSYKARVRKAGRAEVSKTFTYRSDALKWAKKIEGEAQADDAGIVSPGHKLTLTEAIQRYRRERLPELSEGAAETYSAHLTFWGDRLGHLKLSELTPERIARERDGLAEAGKKPSTVNRYLAALGAVLTRAVKHWHTLKLSPLAGVAKLRETGARKRFLSEPELARLLEACRASVSDDLVTVVLLAVGSGARRGEILGLRWRNVDLARECFTVEDSKNHDSRTLPIPRAALGLLSERKARADAASKVVALRDERLVFPSRFSASKSIDIRTSWQNAVEAAGLGDFHFHDLRHSAASFMAMDGLTLREIGEALGHRCTQTSRRYAHLAESHTQTLVRAVADKRLGGDSK